MTLADWLPLVWGCILGFVIIMYVILDGFVLGVGMLFLTRKSKNDRDIMMNTVAPIWDGNATWAVMGGATLYGAFPLAFSTLLPSFYSPLMIMLAALIFRGLAFEFRLKAKRIFVWDFSFFFGSVLATFMQGMILGTYLQGYDVIDGRLTIHALHWISPFSVMCGMAVIVAYCLLGATWLILKTVDSLQDAMYKRAFQMVFGMGFFIAVVSIWTPFIEPLIRERWFTLPNFFYLLPFPLATVGVGLWLLHSLKKYYELQPFLLNIGLFLFTYAGLAVSLFPFIIPYQTTSFVITINPKSH